MTQISQIYSCNETLHVSDCSPVQYQEFSLYTQQWYVSYRFADSLRANLYDIYNCCVYSKKTPDDGQRNCPKHVEFHSKNKFEKLVHLVGFILRNLSRCAVT